MTETENLIKDLSSTHPGLQKKIAIQDEQFNYAMAIMDLRKESGLTQQQLADKIGVPQPTIARWETGNGNITMKNLEKIARAVHKRLVISFK
jgi:DNA-binding XRE family transcriptional regulator